MRRIIETLFNCVQECDSEKSKQELARIIRRELESDFQGIGIYNGNSSTTVRTSEINMAVDGRKLDAVKAYKNRTGLGLLDSKRAIEAAMEDHRLDRVQRQQY